MPRTGQLKRSRTLPGVRRTAAAAAAAARATFVAAVIAITAITAITASPAAAAAQSSEPQWPNFSDALDDRESQRIVVIVAAAEPPPISVLTSASAVSAPLPQAVVGGLFMLGGNWVLTRMWKQRKI